MPKPPNVSNIKIPVPVLPTKNRCMPNPPKKKHSNMVGKKSLSLIAESSVDSIFDLIKSCSYPRNKAKYLSGMSKMLMSDFDGKIPANLEELQKLPGVGRKTANVIGSVYFDIPAMPVDTHVFRVSDRIGLTTKAKNPLEAELQLLRIFPKNKLNIAHHWLILHGRYLCKARRPECERCGIKPICKYYSKK